MQENFSVFNSVCRLADSLRVKKRTPPTPPPPEKALKKINLKQFPLDTHQQRGKSSSDLVQLRNNVVKVDEFEGDRTDNLHGLVTPVAIQRVQGAWAIQVQCVIVQLS